MAKRQPVVVWVDESLKGAKQIEALVTRRGYQVVWVDMQQAHVVLGPRCWRMLPTLIPYLTLALKSARQASQGKVPDADTIATELCEEAATTYTDDDTSAMDVA